jgi:hypothetical protein
MIKSYNHISQRVDSITSKRGLSMANFRTKDGSVIEYYQFALRMASILDKIYFAAKCVEYLGKIYKQRTKSHEVAIDSITKTLPHDFTFYMDVFFTFSYSAFDYVAQVLHMMINTGLKEDQVYFANVIQSLASPKSPNSCLLFDALIKESEKGWIYELRHYRVFTAHHATIPLTRRFSYTAKDQTVEILDAMLPDNPKDAPHTFNKKRELVPYCVDVLSKELDSMKDIFDFIGSLI